jgi:predicted DNA binding protein
MPSGIRATVSFSNPGDCVIARAAFESESTVTQVSTSVTLPGSESVTEFLVPGSVDDLDGIEPVFPYGNAKLYRTHHRGEESCPCECLGGHGCPVHRYEAEDGDLTLVFHAADFESLQAAMEDLQDAYAPVDVQQLLQPPLEGTPEQRVFVNRGKLTDRQQEVLERAFERVLRATEASERDRVGRRARHLAVDVHRTPDDGPAETARGHSHRDDRLMWARLSPGPATNIEIA